jgi:hypothetical protein
MVESYTGRGIQKMIAPRCTNLLFSPFHRAKNSVILSKARYACRAMSLLTGRNANWLCPRINR